jgi:hypothetical protein
VWSGKTAPHHNNKLFAKRAVARNNLHMALTSFEQNQGKIFPGVGNFTQGI